TAELEAAPCDCKALLPRVRCSAIELEARGLDGRRRDEGDRGDLNPRPPGPQPGALTKLSYGHRVANRMAHPTGATRATSASRRVDLALPGEGSQRVGGLEPERFGDGGVRHRAADRRHAAEQGGVVVDRLADAVVGH